MDFYLVDPYTLTNKMYIEAFDSMVWSDRYNEAGEFELIQPFDEYVESMMAYGDYIWCSKSEHYMVVEKHEIKYSNDGTFNLITTGRSVESMLDRRIIWNQITFQKSYIRTVIERLLNANFISPTDAKRKVPGFVFKNTANSSITSETVSKQYTGDNVYDAIVELCKAPASAILGFKLIPQVNGGFIFTLYSPSNYGAHLDDEDYNEVAFSPWLDNVQSSDQTTNYTEYKNFALIAGEGEGTARKTIAFGNSDATGIARKELYVDARDIQSKTEDGKTIPESDYYELLSDRGYDKMMELLSDVNSLESEILPYGTFEYGRDFNLGDYVKIYSQGAANESYLYVKEVTFSVDSEGEKIVPVFGE